MTATATAARPDDGTSPGGQRSDFRFDIQGLRGVSVLLVVLFHADLDLGPLSFTGGFVGVDAFFVISGFVIGLVLFRELDSTGRVKLGSFSARRIRRLLPALSTMLVVTLGLSVLFLSPIRVQEAAAKTARAAALFHGNERLYSTGGDGGGYFDPTEELNPFLHTWSLSVEEQFYLVIPAAVMLLFMIGRRRWGRATAAVGLALVGSYSFFLAVHWTGGGREFDLADPERYAFYGMAGRMWEFIAGAMLAAMAPKLAAIPPAAGRLLATGGAVALVASALVYDATTSFPGATALAPVLGTAAVIAGTTTDRGASALLSIRPLVWVGDRSYSWYLWHWPFVVFGGLLAPDSPWAKLAGATIALLPAMASYRFVENRFRERNPSFVGALPILVVAVALPYAASTGVIQGAEGGWGLGGEYVIDERSTARKNGCHDPFSFEVRGWNEAGCRFGTTESTEGTVLLVGDSHASSLSDVLTDVVVPYGRDLAVWSRSACPFVNRQPDDVLFCADWQESVRSLIDEIEPDLVVLSNRSTVYTNPTVGETAFAVMDESGERTRDLESSIEVWTEGLTEVLADLQARGIPVVLITTIPEYPFSPTERLSILRPDPPTLTTTLDEVEERRGPITRAEEAVAAEFDNVVVYDPVPDLCTPVCTTRDGDTWIYYDDDHLSPIGSRRLQAGLDAAIAEALVR